jgi:hypothetical protein
MEPPRSSDDDPDDDNYMDEGDGPSNRLYRHSFASGGQQKGAAQIL